MRSRDSALFKGLGKGRKMLLPVIVLGVVALLPIVLCIWTYKRLATRNASRRCWAWLLAFGLFGVIVGFYLAFCFRYRASETLIVSSFPIPLAAFHLEDGRWIDFVPDPLTVMVGCFANFCLDVSVMFLPHFVYSFFLKKTPQN